ncbi:hypothetical protein WME94_34735 [Sorangium sp. So ce429]
MFQLPEPYLVVSQAAEQVVSQAAEQRPEKVKTLVYLTAFLLADGQSLNEEWADDEGAEIKTYAPQEVADALKSL